MDEIKRDTVGALSRELLLKEPETRDPIEIQREVYKKDYESGVLEAVERGKKDYKSPFYVVVLIKKERLMPNVYRHYLFPRQTCPRPEWDQVVYRCTVTEHDCNIEYLWNVPDQQTCNLLRDNAVSVVKEERHLLKNVLDFLDGTLDLKAKLYNGELQTQ